MRIAIDSGPLSGGHAVRGVGFYTRFLCEQLTKLSVSKKFTLEVFDFSDNLGKLDSFDVVHYPYFDLFKTSLKIPKEARVVVTIHDVIPLLYPSHYPTGVRGRLNLFRQTMNLSKAGAIITDSEASKKDIVRFLKVEQEKIYPIHLAPNPNILKIKSKIELESIRQRLNLPKEFVLYVGDVNYNKNLVNLVKACKTRNLALVMVGKKLKELRSEEFKISDNAEEAHLRELVREMKDEGVYTPGFVSDKELVAIYNLAMVYCQPSLYEGFGLPVLDAFVCGCPVVANKPQALVEIAEDGAMFTNALSPQKLSESLGVFFDNKSERSKYGELGQRIVEKYSWKKTAIQTYEVYEQILKAR